MSSALILAAGFGTRLRPLTLELPKPLVPVGDRPLLAHVASACRAAGVQTLVANAHHEHEKLSSVIHGLRLNIQVVVERVIRGTAGGVAGARDLLGEGAVLVWNGDILAEPPARELLAQANELDAQVLAVSPRSAGEGSVGLDEEGGVVRLRGRVFGRETSGGDYVGVMALGAGVVAGLPELGCLIGDVALPALEAGKRVWSLPSGGQWSDLGDLAAYVSANFDWLDASGQAAWCSPASRVERGVQIERSLIGAGAVISGAGPVSEVIAWPGAPVQAPLARAVVLGSGRVVPFPGSAEN
jgi:mannose-1-phosphate guanylyltransferase